ncbi:MAG: CHAT domain-containing protein [Magnetococcus sp. WYHC-3]
MPCWNPRRRPPPVAAEVKGGLARAVLDLGQFAEAERLMDEVVAWESQEFGPTHHRTLASLSDLGGVQRQAGRLPEAEEALTRALEGYLSTLGTDHPATLAARNNLGLLLETRGFFDQAEPHLRDGLAAATRVLGAEHPDTLAYTNNLALLYEAQGRFDDAGELYETAIAALSVRVGADHADTLALVNNLAYLHLLRQAPGVAQPLFARVLQGWTTQLGADHPRTLKAANNLGRTLHLAGQLEPARELLDATLEKRRALLGADHIDTIRSLIDSARLASARQDIPRARALADEARERAQRVLGPQHPMTFEALTAQADLARQTARIDDELALRQEIFNRRTQFLDRMLWATGEDARQGYIQLYRPELDAYLALLARLPATQAAPLALEVAMRRKGLLLSVSSAIVQTARLSDDPAVGAIARELTTTRKTLAQRLLAGPNPGEDLPTVLRKMEQRIDELEFRLGQASLRFRKSRESPQLETLVQRLPETAALVDFMIFQDGTETRLLAALLIKREGDIKQGFVAYPDMKPINALIDEFRKLIQDPDSNDDEVIELGQALYEPLWEPFAAQLEGIEDVYVVPDGLLHITPIGALADAEGNRLVQVLDLHYLTSSRDLLPDGAPPAQGGVLILAGPQYDSNRVVTAAKQAEINQRRSMRSSASFRSSLGMRGLSRGLRGLQFDPLPGAEQEGELITGVTRKSGQKSTVYLRADAEEALLRQRTQAPEVLHIATHGFFLKEDDTLKKRLLRLERGAEITIPPPSDNPLLRAGLAFSGINTNAQFLGEIDSDNDGVLTAMEVLSLDLTGTRLAVLSACETGLGEVHQSEGIYGLRRAFQEAGVRSVINSLWEVSDDGTQALMTEFYRRMLKGDSPQKAMRGAQLALMKNPQWDYPYIWSAFFLVGE